MGTIKLGFHGCYIHNGDTKGPSHDEEYSWGELLEGFTIIILKFFFIWMELTGYFFLYFFSFFHN